MVPEVVLDASALLALLNAEPGGDAVAEALPRAIMSAVNLSEVVGRLCGAGIAEKAVQRIIKPLGLEIDPFDEEQAYPAGSLRMATRNAGISLGDRACLGLGKKLGLPVLTADRTWMTLSVGVTVKVIR